MSLKFKFMSVFASAVVLGSLATFTSAQDPVQPSKDGAVKSEKHARKAFGKKGGFNKGMRGKFGGAHGFRGIELTETQKEQMKQIREANRPDPAMFEEMKAIREAHRSGTLTEDQKAQMKAFHDQSRVKGEAVRQQMLAILTPEQHQQIEARKAEMRTKMQERRLLRQKKSATPGTTNDN